MTEIFLTSHGQEVPDNLAHAHRRELARLSRETLMYFWWS